MLRAAALATLTLALSACANEAAETDEATGNVHIYETRGRVVELPDPERPLSDFLVHHEPIPAFKEKFDETVPTGMNAMVMPFPPADGLSLEGVQPGDILSLRFRVNYHPDNAAVSNMTLLEFEQLPKETQLDLGRAK